MVIDIPVKEPKKITAYARAKTLGEHRLAFFAANGIKNDSEEEYNDTVNNYFDIALKMRESEFITFSIFNAWKYALNKCNTPGNNKDHSGIITKMLGYGRGKTLMADIKRFKGSLPNPRYQVPMCRFRFQNNESNKEQLEILINDFIKSKLPDKYYILESSEITTDCFHRLVSRLIEMSGREESYFNKSDFRCLCNICSTDDDPSLNSKRHQNLITYMVGYESHWEIRQLITTPKCRIPFKRTKKEYEILLHILNTLRS